ncbi:hypothetical protein KSS87_019691 [Heliosperma pusillum]|nr:hypothetical protein KSS87_019691 [Heliosperma pusillum]
MYLPRGLKGSAGEFELPSPISMLAKDWYAPGTGFHPISYCSNDVYDFDTGADKNKLESVVNIAGRPGLGSSGCWKCAFNIVVALCSCVWLCISVPTISIKLSRTRRAFVLCSIWTIGYSSILFDANYVQVEGDKEVGKFSLLVRIGQKAGSRVVKIAVVALYVVLFVLGIGKTLPLVTTDNERIFMAKYYCVRLHALFGLALAAGLVAARRFGKYAPIAIFP